MTVRYIPNTGNNALFFVSAGRGVLHLLDSLAGTVSETYDAKVGDGHCVLTLPFRNSTRIMLSIYTSDQVRVWALAWVHGCKHQGCLHVWGLNVGAQQQLAQASYWSLDSLGPTNTVGRQVPAKGQQVQA